MNVTHLSHSACLAMQAPSQPLLRRSVDFEAVPPVAEEATALVLKQVEALAEAWSAGN